MNLKLAAARSESSFHGMIQPWQQINREISICEKDAKQGIKVETTEENGRKLLHILAPSIGGEKDKATFNIVSILCPKELALSAEVLKQRGLDLWEGLIKELTNLNTIYGHEKNHFKESNQTHIAPYIFLGEHLPQTLENSTSNKIPGTEYLNLNSFQVERNLIFFKLLLRRLCPELFDRSEVSAPIFESFAFPRYSVSRFTRTEDKLEIYSFNHRYTDEFAKERGSINGDISSRRILFEIDPTNKEILFRTFMDFQFPFGPLNPEENEVRPNWNSFDDYQLDTFLYSPGLTTAGIQFNDFKFTGLMNRTKIYNRLDNPLELEPDIPTLVPEDVVIAFHNIMLKQAMAAGFIDETPFTTGRITTALKHHGFLLNPFTAGLSGRA